MRQLQFQLLHRNNSSTFARRSPSAPATRDDFGLAGLGRAIEATRTLSLSNTKTPPSLYLSSVLSMEDLGLPHHVRTSIRVSYAYALMKGKTKKEFVSKEKATINIP